MTFATTKVMFPQSRYYGKITPKNLMFNSNLQELQSWVIYGSIYYQNNSVN